VCALGDGIADAARRAYEAAARVRFRGMQYRRDIGGKA
jgi:phosphoribosylamine--glycine ligase